MNLDAMIEGFFLILQVKVLLIIALGCAFGIICGALPGVSETLAVGLALPFTFVMSAPEGISLLSAVYCGGVLGAGITATLIRVPGTSAGLATLLDGYPLAQKGFVFKALFFHHISSVAGGITGGIVLILLAPMLSQVALVFGPPEYFVLALFGMGVAATLSLKSPIKGLMSIMLGLLIATVGLEASTGSQRFTFGKMYLFDGLPLVPMIVGMFALGEVFSMIEKGEQSIGDRAASKININIKLMLKYFREWLSYKGLIIKSAIIGTIIGIIPAAGTGVAAFIAYNEAYRKSKKKEKFGNGSIEGIIAAEASNNAVCGGSIVPLITLGIPGSSVAAVFFGGLLVHGIRPGPDLFFGPIAPLAFMVCISFVAASIVMLPISLLMAKTYAKVVLIPKWILAPVLVGLATVGAYASRNMMADITVAFFAGVMAYYLQRNGYSLIVVVLAMVLGPIAEVNLMRSLDISGGSLMILFTRPICILLFVLLFISVWVVTKGSKKKET